MTVVAAAVAGRNKVRREGVVELVRRGASLLLLVIAAVEALADLAAPSWIDGLLWTVPALATYTLIPWPTAPEGALRHERLPSTVMPDMIGLLLGVAFFALPLVLMNNDPLLEGGWPILLVFWPLGLFALGILYIAARYACSWVRLHKGAIEIAGLWAIVELPFTEIDKVKAIERKLPGWVGPALVLFGGWRGAGVALLHAGRAAHYLEFERKTAPPLRMSVDALPSVDRVLKALARAGVPLDTDVAGSAEQAARKRKPRRVAKPS